jgi:DNA-binding HxlR family transcriptional regulator
MIVYKQTQFNSFMYTVDGINPKTLTARRQELELNDVIERKVYLEVTPRVEYSHSEK